MALALTPDQIAQAFIDTLSPGGVPVGSIGAITKRTPDTPYQGPLPILMVEPSQNVHGRAAAAGVAALGRMDQGIMDLTLRDSPPSQGTRTLSQIEDAKVAARDAIVATLVANPTLAGAITICAERIEEAYNPDGNFISWQGSEWIGLLLRVPYMGPLQ